MSEERTERRPPNRGLIAVAGVVVLFFIWLLFFDHGSTVQSCNSGATTVALNGVSTHVQNVYSCGANGTDVITLDGGHQVVVKPVKP